MFVDPITFSLNAVAQSLPRTSQTGTSAKYVRADGLLTLSISHADAKRTRSVLRLDLKKVAPDPLQPATSVPYTMSTYVVLDKPLEGFTVAEQGQLVTALATIAADVTYQAKFVSGQS